MGITSIGDIVAGVIREAPKKDYGRETQLKNAILNQLKPALQECILGIKEYKDQVIVVVNHSLALTEIVQFYQYKIEKNILNEFQDVKKIRFLWSKFVNF